MPKIDKNIRLIDRIKIYYHTSKKVFRGIFKGIGIRKKFPLFIGKKVDLTHKNHIKCGKNVKFEDYSEIHGLSKYGINLGNNVTIGRYTEIRPSSYYGVGKIGYGIEIGDNSSIGPNGFVGCSGKIIIGKNVMIGPKVSFFAENHNFKEKHRTIKEQGVFNKGIQVEDDCWIGSNVVILDGVTIGRGSVIGAGTLVNKDIPPESIVYDHRQKIRKER